MLLIATLLFVAGCSNATSNPVDSYGGLELEDVQVDVAAVERTTLSSEVEFTGNLLPKRVTRITSEVDGIVIEIPQVGAKFDVVMNGKRYSEQLGITFGQAVRKGDVLVQLDAEDFRISLLMAQAKLAKANADLAKLVSWERAEAIQKLTAMRDEAKARHEQAVRDEERLQQLLRQNATSRSDYEQVAMSVNTTRAVLDSAEATLTSAKAGPTKEEIAVQQALVTQAEVEMRQAQRELDKTTIRAPYDGIITAINVEIGDRVSASNGAIIDLMDLRYLIAEISVPEKYIGSFRVSDQSKVQAVGQAQPVPGLVIAINEMVDPQSRTFKVRIAIDNEQRQFKAGQFASVTLPMSAALGETLSVPKGSIVFLEGQPTVFVVNGERVNQRPVEVGIENQAVTEVLSGVNEGDVVVIDDPTLLADGMKVRVNQHQLQM
tara:strand:+ start:10657 stop:11958 length:1302 start_codon:yes stop_codon:yes gene_type:complete